jgi:hypothetical protein
MSANAELTAEKEKVQARFALAMDAIRTFHTGVSEDFLLRERPFDALRTKLIRGASDFYRKLEGMLRGRPDPPSRKALGDAYFELGGLTARALATEEALALYRQGLAVRRALLVEAPDAPSARADVAESLLEVGAMLEATGHPALALSPYKEAEALLEPAAGGGGSGEREREDLGLCVMRSGHVLKDTGHLREALAAHNAARCPSPRRPAPFQPVKPT